VDRRQGLVDEIGLPLTIETPYHMVDMDL